MPAARPPGWAGLPAWRVLDIGSRTAAGFLACWAAWRADPERPPLLHHVTLIEEPPRLSALRDLAQAEPRFAALVDELAPQWWGLGPGFHRLVLDDARVRLTLCIGDPARRLREQAASFDAIELHAVADAGSAPSDIGQRSLVRSIARLCRPGSVLRLAGDTPDLGQALASTGFVQDGVAGAPAQVRFAPAWALRRRHTPATVASHCTVIGGGLAGAAAAASLARRGWAVQVLDAAAGPASQASGVPAGLLAPHRSPDDNLLSRLSRCGVRLTLQQAHALLREGVDWQRSGALECRTFGLGAGDGAALSDTGERWTRAAGRAQRDAALLDDDVPAVWHPHAAWIRPAALVRAWLAQPGIRWRGGTPVASLAHDGVTWRLMDHAGTELAASPLVVLAAGHLSADLSPQPLPLQPVRGQVSWGLQAPGDALPGFPVNGDGHFMAGITIEGASAWLCGSTYDRGDTGLEPRASDHAANLARLGRLLPGVAAQLAPRFAEGVRSWTGIRCASGDRRPLVGELAPGLWLSTALGSRGLTFAALCAELLAARLHQEPLPLPRALAESLSSARLRLI